MPGFVYRMQLYNLYCVGHDRRPRRVTTDMAVLKGIDCITIPTGDSPDKSWIIICSRATAVLMLHRPFRNPRMEGMSPEQQV